MLQVPEAQTACGAGGPETGGEGGGPRGGDETRLWREWREHGDLGAREVLVQRYVPYAKALARRVFRGLSADGVELEDCEQFAMVGLLESLDRYEPTGGASFKTFSFTRVQGAVRNGLERLTERRQWGAARRRAGAERVASLVVGPLSLGDADELLEELGEIGVGLALGVLLEDGAAGPAWGAEMGANPYVQYEARQMQRLLWELVPRLTQRERRVIELHYGEGVRFEEVARRLGVSKGRVSQLHRQGISRLQELAGGAEFCDVTA